MKSARERMDIISAYREVGSYRGAAAISGTTPKTVRRVIARHEWGGAPPARVPRGHNYDAVVDLVAERVERLKRMFASAPDIRVRLDTDGGKVLAEVVVLIRGYRTLKACSKADDAGGAVDKAVKKLEWKYKLFWTRGSFRFGDCC